ncbi:MAG: hypothetical protein KC549_15950, partial [Myxococcales bacterium]|nr:hypothetical protein [Myxococcales bacterium]
GDDDDCDTRIDEGTLNACGQCGAVPAEVCDGVDQDCDGRVDEDLGGEACLADAPGVCAAGRTACVDDVMVCVAGEALGIETCDGRDEDCDGRVDEGCDGCADGETRRCETECGEGEETCSDATFGGCDAPLPGDEFCDGRDNDCDGEIDEDVFGDLDPCSAGVGFCEQIGTRRCIDGVFVCDASPRDPRQESCNLRDDDCDGVVDEQAPCPTGQSCQHGSCVDPCDNLECPGMFACVEGWCVDPCDVLTCDAGQLCRAGRCVDACAGVDCAAGEICNGEGRCGPDDCFHLGCGDGQRCGANGCEADPCAGVDCGVGEFCRDGQCIPSCGDVSCPFMQACVDGACEDEPCVEVTCPEGEVCEHGACGPDVCAAVDCPEGQRCQNGACIFDDCYNIDCPPAERCVIINNRAQCVWAGDDEPVAPVDPDGGVEPPPSPDYGAVDWSTGAPDFGIGASEGTGGGSGDSPEGDCACDAGKGGSAPLGLFVVAGLLAVRRRRRR